ncbi:MAG: ABC transporter permease [Planctomycetaceae bacterium]
MTILCGIAVPLVLLLGLTDGLVRQQERDFLRSPSAIQIRASVTGAAPPITRDLERQWEQQDDIAQVIPDITKVVTLKNTLPDVTLTGITVRCTKPGDRLLGFYGVDVLKTGEPGIVISQRLADALKVEYQADPNGKLNVTLGQKVTLTATRQDTAGASTADVDVPVEGVADFGGASMTGYLTRDFMDHIEDYQQGRTVAAFNWQGSSQPVPVAYNEYLAFTREPLSTMDNLKLKAHGLTAELLDARTPAGNVKRTLFGLLDATDLMVYRVFASSTLPDAAPDLTQPGSKIEAITDVDDVVVGWVTPQVRELAGEKHRLVGLSLRKRWLKKKFINERVASATALQDLQILLPDEQDPPRSMAMNLPGVDPLSLAPLLMRSNLTPTTTPPTPATGAAGQTGKAFVAKLLGLQVPAQPQTSISATPGAASLPIAVTSTALLSRLAFFDRGEAAWDAAQQTFVRSTEDNDYYQARVVARDIHTVPQVDAWLRKLGYATQSQSTRVEELQGYAKTLRLLVYVVGGTVFFFGFWTLAAALAENTDRKRRSLGTLRSLGVGRMGVCYIVVLRGLMIGVVAGIVMLPLAKLLGVILSRTVADCQVTNQHLILVFAVSLGSCMLGVIGPGIMATMTSPGVILKDE